MNAESWIALVGIVVSLLAAIVAGLYHRQGEADKLAASHGERLAKVEARHEGLDGRLDRQDGILDKLDRNVTAIMLKMGVRPSPNPDRKE